MSEHDKAKNIEQEQAPAELLKPFGYSGLFSYRDEIQDAFEYVAQIGDATGAKSHVVTACMVYVNTLLRVLHHNGMLNLEHSPLHQRIKDLEKENEELKFRLEGLEK